MKQSWRQWHSQLNFRDRDNKNKTVCGGGHRPFRLQVVRLWRHGTSICVILRRFVSEHSLKSRADTRREVVTGPSAAGPVSAPLCMEEQEEQNLTMTLSRLILNRPSESEWKDWTPLWYHEGSMSFSRTCAQSPTACRFTTGTTSDRCK